MYMYMKNTLHGDENNWISREDKLKLVILINKDTAGHDVILCSYTPCSGQHVVACWTQASII